MNTPPGAEGPGDELLEAYRRASREDPARPDPQRRAAIFAAARAAVAPEEPEASGAPVAPVATPRTAAANDDHWGWRAVAGLAIFGLLGALVSYNFRNPGQARTALVARAPALPAPAPASPAPAAAPAPTAHYSLEQGVAEQLLNVHDESLPGNAPLRSARARDKVAGFALASPPEPSLARSTAAAAAGAMDRAPAADQLSSRSQVAAAEVAAHDVASVRQAVIARYAGLFKPVGSATVNLLTVYLANDGSIDRARVDAIGGAAVSAGTAPGPGPFLALGLQPGQLDAIGQLHIVLQHTEAQEPDTELFVNYAWPPQPRQ